MALKIYYFLVQQQRVEESWLENIRNSVKMAYGGGVPGSSAHLLRVSLIHEYFCYAFMIGWCSLYNREFSFDECISSFVMQTCIASPTLAIEMLLH